MGRRRAYVELLMVLVVVASVAWIFQQPKTSPEFGVTEQTFTLEQQQEEWASIFGRAQAAIRVADLERAEAQLLKAEALAKDFPPGDMSLAETLDDLGQVTFRQSQWARAESFQGRAVAARLLAGGPDDGELAIYVQRYEWALAKWKPTLEIEMSSGKIAAYNFVLDYQTGVSTQRFTAELTRLKSEYQEKYDTEALVALNKL